MSMNARLSSSNVVRYLEHKYIVYIHEGSLRKRRRWQIFRQCPHDREVMLLIERLHYMSNEGNGISFDYVLSGADC